MKHCENHTSHCQVSCPVWLKFRFQYWSSDWIGLLQLCQARGFICEICLKQDVIFPWQINNVLRCKKCGSCHHAKCFKKKPVCPKCARITNRNSLHQMCLGSAIISWQHVLKVSFLLRVPVRWYDSGSSSGSLKFPFFWTGPMMFWFLTFLKMSFNFNFSS